LAARKTNRSTSKTGSHAAHGGGAQEGRAAADQSLGDDVGAAELAQRVAENLRRKRKARNMSLDDLARASGVSRAALSQVETVKTNPTVGLLWKIAVGLGVPFADLIGEVKSGTAVLRRGDAQVLRSLDNRPDRHLGQLRERLLGKHVDEARRELV